MVSRLKVSKQRHGSRRVVAERVGDIDRGIGRHAANSAHDVSHLSVASLEASEDVSMAMYIARDTSEQLGTKQLCVAPVVRGQAGETRDIAEGAIRPTHRSASYEVSDG